LVGTRRRPNGRITINPLYFEYWVGGTGVTFIKPYGQSYVTIDVSITETMHKTDTKWAVYMIKGNKQLLHVDSYIDELKMENHYISPSYDNGYISKGSYMAMRRNLESAGFKQRSLKTYELAYFVLPMWTYDPLREEKIYHEITRRLDSFKSLMFPEVNFDIMRLKKCGMVKVQNRRVDKTGANYCTYCVCKGEADYFTPQVYASLYSPNRNYRISVGRVFGCAAPYNGTKATLPLMCRDQLGKFVQRVNKIAAYADIFMSLGIKELDVYTDAKGYKLISRYKRTREE
jgi:hypothetical protein